jgi:hypothetical protein
MPGILAFCRVALGLTFFLALVGKLRHIRSFHQTLVSFRLLPAKLTTLAATLVLGSEAGVVICMLLGSILLLAGFLLAAMLLLAFSGVLAVGIARKQRLSCQCFGATSEQVSPVDLWRNAGLLLCAGGGCGVQIWLAQGQPLDPITWLLVTCIAIAFVLLWTQLNTIVRLFREVSSAR